MAPLRMPRGLSEPTHVDTGEAVLKFELLEELDAVHRAEERVERAVAALRDHDADGGPPAARPTLVDAAADAVWRLIVQHEASDCTDHGQLMRRYGVPADVLARIGAMSDAP